ncbi:NAD(P)H-dependent oxidoreductase [Nostoc sp. FACHB-152]|uniref:NADPH-dependent FMN reductase n=1 Tax=unclassified Nostoc TaxID=2593658 RepID=UPI001689EB66|nr:MULTISPECIES: NAD(P)H-dependent oxidoreductase [unclassified Nostoc]MBD2445627.1 NAD(P)H-dependent oxidoreductase [Nostoc sp. FACHB-152]MBD2466740.1 NAD(P)H-dependent oxidoreductase [Nostoc sp. FACHB-145]
MADTPKILAFAGSTRTDSYNKKLVKIAAAGAQAAGAEVTYIDLRDLPLPLFDEDLEAQEGMPANAQTLKNLFISHQGLLIASPEYNSSLTAVLKNAIDWVSRPAPDEPPLAAFAGKAAVIMSASPGGLGGLRGLVHLRSILGNIKVLVLPDQVAVPNAYAAFNDDGTLKEPKQQQSIEKLGESLANILFKLNS